MSVVSQVRSVRLSVCRLWSLLGHVRCVAAHDGGRGLDVSTPIHFYWQRRAKRAAVARRSASIMEVIAVRNVLFVSRFYVLMFF